MSNAGLYVLHDTGFAEVVEMCRAFGPKSEAILNSVIHGEAGEMIYERINPLIHPSGRTWRGKERSATSSNWPRYMTNEHLAVTVGAKRAWHYLYFPDDGSNTERHAGGQMFMRRGAQAAVPDIADAAIERLCGEFNG